MVRGMVLPWWEGGGDWNYDVVDYVPGGGGCVGCNTSGGCISTGGSAMLLRT
jgi:hypothetical protein